MARYSGLTGSAGRIADASILVRGGAMRIRGAVRSLAMPGSRGPLFLGRRVLLSGSRHIAHTGRLVIEDGAEVQGVSRRGLTFGDGVSIGPGAMIRPSSYYGGPVGEGLVMGDRSSIGSGCFIGCSGWIEIGDDVMLGPGVRVFSENHVFADTSASIKSQGVERGVTVIEDDCWIASGVTITSGVRIGRGSVIAAGSVVTKDIPPFSVAGGVPAKVLRSRREESVGE